MCVAGPLAPVRPPCCRGRSPGPGVSSVGAWPVPGPRENDVSPCPVSCATSVRRGGVAVSLGPVCPQWGRGRFVAQCVRPEGVSVPFSPCVVVTSWHVLRSRGFRGGAGPISWASVSAMGSWLVHWAPCIRSEGVANPLGPVCPPCWRGLSTAPRVSSVRRDWSSGPCPSVVVACPVFWASSSRRIKLLLPLAYNSEIVQKDRFRLVHLKMRLHWDISGNIHR